MTFIQLVESISEDTGVPMTKVARVLHSLEEKITASTMSGDPVTLWTFGYFYGAELPEKELFGGSRNGKKRRTIRFKESRTHMDKYSVVIDEEKTKTAGDKRVCPKCGLVLKEENYCERCGTEPWEKRPEANGRG